MRFPELIPESFKSPEASLNLPHFIGLLQARESRRLELYSRCERPFGKGIQTRRDFDQYFYFLVAQSKGQKGRGFYYRTPERSDRNRVFIHREDRSGPEGQSIAMIQARDRNRVTASLLLEKIHSAIPGMPFSFYEDERSVEDKILSDEVPKLKLNGFVPWTYEL